jgi:hypothetical protein
LNTADTCFTSIRPHKLSNKTAIAADTHQNARPGWVTISWAAATISSN